MGQKSGFINRLSGTTGLLGQAALAFMIMSIVYDVIMRYIFAAPTHWALEVNTFLLVFFCTIPTADVLNANGHIRVAFLAERLSPRIQSRLLPLRGVLGLVFCAVMTWKGGVMALQAWQSNDRMSTSLGTPMVIPYMFLPIGFCLLGLEYSLLLKPRSKTVLPRSDGSEAKEQITKEGQQI